MLSRELRRGNREEGLVGETESSKLYGGLVGSRCGKCLGDTSRNLSKITKDSVLGEETQ